MKLIAVYIVFIIIIVLSIFARFYQLDSIPPGLNIDESSQGYNAYSLLNTGKDRYGESFPILFRLFDSIQVPMYTYLTIIPVYLFGNSIFAVRFVSALSGVILVILTFFLIKTDKKNINLALIASFLVAISPWAVFYSRITTESSLGVMLFVASIMCFYLSINRRKILLPAMLILGLSTHAYYSERILSYLFLVGFIGLFRKKLISHKKILILGIIIFVITQIPHLWIANSGAFTRRIIQVNYFSQSFFQENGGELRFIPGGRWLYIIREFASQYMAYYSPRNLFLDQDPQTGVRTMPDLSVFYSWMIVPFFIGFRKLIIDRHEPLSKILIILITIGPFAGSLTRDPFATIRVLGFLWSITLIISLGLVNILELILKIKLKLLVIFLVILVSLTQLYLAYFVLLKYERAHNYGYSYMKLLANMNQMKDKRFVVDTTREPAAGIMFAYLNKYDPSRIQKLLNPLIAGKYYSSFDPKEIYIVDNVEAKPIVWTQDICKDQILVGDLLAISDEQVKEHYLSFLFDIKDLAGDVTLKAYLTSPNLACRIHTTKI